MKRKCKVISGQENGKDFIRHPNKYFSTTEKHHIIQEYQRSGSTKQEIWEKYTGQKVEHGQLLYWMRQLGYVDSNNKEISKFAFESNIIMAGQEREDIQTIELKKRIAELESELKDAQMKSIAFSTMIDIAEQEFNISIRKKFNTKPSKK